MTTKIPVARKRILYFLGFSILASVGYSIWWTFYSIYVLLSIFILPDTSVYSVSEFNKEVWFEQERIYHPEPGVYGWIDCTRGRMYEDLDKNYLKNYMRKEEVEAILGHSTVAREYPDSWIFKHIFKCFQYELGTCRNGPPTILRFCAIKGTNSYSHKLSDENDGGRRILEDRVEVDKKHDELRRKNEEASRLRRERERQKVKENNND